MFARVWCSHVSYAFVCERDFVRMRGLVARKPCVCNCVCPFPCCFLLCICLVEDRFVFGSLRELLVLLCVSVTVCVFECVSVHVCYVPCVCLCVCCTVCKPMLGSVYMCDTLCVLGTAQAFVQYAHAECLFLGA